MQTTTAAESRFDEKLLEISSEMDEFEGYTHPHGLRIAMIADAIGKQFSLAAHDRFFMQQAALVHDIGEVVMNREYIKEIRGLTPDEFLDMQRHPVIGEQETARRGMSRGVQLLPGFRGEQLITARITPNDSFCADGQRCVTFYNQVLDSIQQSPSITGAALVNTPPLGGRVAKRSFDVEGFTVPSGEPAPLFWMNTVTPDYFQVMGIPVLGGRGIAESDRTGGPLVAAVSAATARRYWPGENPLGKRLRIVNTADWFTVVGVVDDVRAFNLQQNEPAWIGGTVYAPYSARVTMENDRIPVAMTLVVWTQSEPSTVEATIRRVVSGLNANVPVGEISTMGARKLAAAATPASIATLFAVFAALALVLGIVGIYGVLSYLVSKRTHEIGVRLALGADRTHVLWLMLREGLKLSAVGIGVGIAGAIVASRLLTNELYGISPLDPITYITVALGMSVATVLACWIPTRRATRVDPLVTLRQS